MLKTVMLSAYALVGVGLLGSGAVAQSVAPLGVETNVKAYAFDLSQLSLLPGRFNDNQNRTLAYLRWVDVNRLLYVFRANHKLSTGGAQSNGGWDAPNFPFRSHMQGHFLTAWAQCYASLKDSTCKDKATTMVAEMAKCQANNGAAGFQTGYLSGFPESDFQALEARTLSSGNVPYYAVHKTLAGLLDVWRLIGDDKAKSVLLALAGWVDTRTGKLNSSQMQSVMGTEFGGMAEVLTDIWKQTGDKRWLTVAARFDHSVLDALANNQDNLNGLHANTQVPKWIGAAKEYKATGTQKYLNIARNAWSITVNSHTYAIGGNSQAEHFRPANQIASQLKQDTAESCNTYNMLKLTRELWLIDPTSVNYFDYYERAVLNQMLGQQNPADSHGHVTYFTPLNPGGKRGVGPAWGGGTWSTDYNSFWCCQGTGIETHTKFMDSIYFYDNSSTLYVNLFIASKLNWSQKGVTISQTTTFPVSEKTTLTVSGSGTFSVKVRIPGWTSGATIKVNGADVSGVTTTPGSYATIPSRAWANGDVIDVTLPMSLRTIAANDDANTVAVAYGPAVLAGNYGNSAVSGNPSLQISSIKRNDNNSLAFTATSNGQSVKLGPFYDAHGFNYVVYWRKA